MSYRVWVIGLDGATFDLILPWVEAGYLPTFAKLINEGAWGEVRSTIPPITGPAWSSFLTGVNPGKHGVFDWVYRKPGSYEFSPVTSEHISQPSLWQIASQANKRVMALNVPMTYPLEAINGLMVSGLPATTLVTFPVELKQQILEKIPGYVVYPDPGQAYSIQGIDTFLECLAQANRGLKQLWQMLVRQEAWDIAMMVFNATDVVQHAMWKFMSPAHPQYDPQLAARYGNAILQVYQEMDKALQEIINMMDDHTILMVMSDHGFGPFHKFIHVNTWLIREGLMKIKRTPLARFKELLFKLGFAPMPIYNLLIRLGLGKLKREVVRGRGQGLLQTLFLSFKDVDWSRTVAYSLGNIGQIRINLKGREPQGIIEPGVDYDQTIADITLRLQSLRDPANQQLVVEQVFRQAEVYQGEAAQNGADILFLPHKLEYFGFGEYEFGDHRTIAPVTSGISGTHRMNGIGLVWGKAIQPIQFSGVRLEDLAPTILHLAGLAVPAHMDGRVLVEMLDPRAGLPGPQISTAWVSHKAAVSDLDEQDEQRIRERLRDLGYVA